MLPGPSGRESVAGPGRGSCCLGPRLEFESVPPSLGSDPGLSLHAATSKGLTAVLELTSLVSLKCWEYTHEPVILPGLLIAYQVTVSLLSDSFTPGTRMQL